jgi:hypothetical protein
MWHWDSGNACQVTHIFAEGERHKSKGLVETGRYERVLSGFFFMKINSMTGII